MTTKYPPTKIEVFRPHIGEEEIDAVADVMRSGWIGRGPKVEEFESEWARHIDVPKENVVSVGCATEGLYQIMQHIVGGPKPGIGGHGIVIPDNSFIGTASAVLESGMTVSLCDVGRDTLNPTRADYLTAYNKSDNFPTGIVYQHYGGFTQDPAFLKLFPVYDGLDLIEDFACHPMGKPVGDYAVYSFDAMKVLTCGDGGMVYCRDVGAVEAIRQATRLGMTTESGKSNSSDRWWEFRAVTPGRRSIMNDIGAAIGLVQLKRLDDLVARRNMIWEMYHLALSDLKYGWLGLPPIPNYTTNPSFYTFWISCDGDGVRDRLAQYLRSKGIYSTYRYFSVSRAYGWDVNTPNSHWASDHCLSIPLHPGLTDDNVSFICDTIAEFGRTL